jgi:nuclear pore complex protein Nup205
LNLDELRSAALFHAAQQGAQEFDRSPLTTAILQFQNRRQFLLESLRIVIRLSVRENDKTDPDTKEYFGKRVRKILNVTETSNANAYAYWAKCLARLNGIELWIQQLADREQSAQIIGQIPSSEVLETNDFQRKSLIKQHESLCAICTDLIRPYANLENFRMLLSKVKGLDRHDLLTIHYVPILICFTSYLHPDSGLCNTDQARSLTRDIVSKEGDPWGMRNLQAATTVWWLAEYSGRYIESNANDATQRGVDPQTEAEERSTQFMDALKDGAFHFMLSISQDIKPTKWYDPAKAGLVSHLLHETLVLPTDISPQPLAFFQTLLMEQMQSFVEAFITNMPDTLRKLKAEEDEQRKLLHSRFQRGPVEYELHLERFLIIIGYAFDGFAEEAAELFWSDPEGNLFGFLQWAAKRQPTPRIAAFCEMLKSLSSGMECADAAHKFLLDEGGSLSGKIRRTSSLSYTHIFNELNELGANIHEPMKTTQGALYPTAQNPADQIVEPESAMMLESYLRLLGHLCRESQEARQWMLNNTIVDVKSLYTSLCVDKVESRLRASVFSALAALLTEKSPAISTAMWNELEKWTATGFIVNARQSSLANPSRHNIWEALAIGYDESYALVELLRALIEPYHTGDELRDTLPFPEHLGSAHRMPGIDSYVDFVVGRVFGGKCAELPDGLQRQVLRWNCLSFIFSSLASFNEHLVVFANKSNIPVDSVMQSSSLAAYVRLHPFTRVMDWLFNEKVLKELFATAFQSESAVDDAFEDSPLVLSLILSIKTMDLLLTLQSTYLDIVRPLLKSSQHRTTVSNPVLASFEDAVLNSLDIVTKLGYYCGSGHTELAVVSLRLLEKLASSRKLVVSPTAGFGQRSTRSKVVGIMEKDNNAERISRSLIDVMKQDPRELEVGLDAPGYIIKNHILDFVNSCLATVPNRPTIAHLLLGFSCGNANVSIAPEGLWANHISLFHTILHLAAEYPETNETQYVTWLSALKRKCLEVLDKLWKSPLTSELVMSELRDFDFAFMQAVSLQTVDFNTLWDGETIEGDNFLLTTSAIAFQNFLRQRSLYCEYVAKELRLNDRAGMPTQKARIQSSLLGLTTFPGGAQFPNPTIFDIFDFMELEVHEPFGVPPLVFLNGLDLDICKRNDQGLELYDLELVQEFIRLRRNELIQSGVIETSVEPMVPRGGELRQNGSSGLDLQEEEDTLLLCLQGNNERAKVVCLQEETLRAWTQLTTVALQSCDFEPGVRTAFVLQTLQVILPKLEKSYEDSLDAAVDLSSLAGALVKSINFDSTSFEKTQTGDFANDRLSQLFRVSLIGVYSAGSTAQLRQACYHTCYRYLRGTAKVSNGSPLGRHILSTVKNSGDRLVEVLCDDAYAGTGTCKVSALLFLDSLVAMCIREGSNHIIDAFVRLNFVSVLVDQIKHIPAELKAATASGKLCSLLSRIPANILIEVPVFLSYYDASLALLARISQTRLGAAQVLNAGLFRSVQESQIFFADPDIGLGKKTPH